MNKKNIIITFGFALLVFGFTLAQDLTWRPVNFKYQNGKGSKDATGDTLANGAASNDADTIYFGLDPKLYPMELHIWLAKNNQNNADSITSRLDRGFDNTYETGTLDTIVAATGAGVGTRALSFSNTTSPSPQYRYIVTQIGGDDTDSTVYRIGIWVKNQQ